MRKRFGYPVEDSDLEIVQTDDGSNTLRQIGTQTTWHSESGALAESELVFIQNSGFADRCENQKPSRILEIGFGTGLNFWLAASLAINFRTPLNYVSLETDLLPVKFIQKLSHDDIPQCQPAFQLFAHQIFPEQANGQSDITPFANRVIHCESVSLSLSTELKSLAAAPSFDAIFHDPFSPEVAPQLWATEYFAKLRKYLGPNGRLVTYCVKSSVQRALKQVGFEIEKTPGPVGGKREVLIAHNVV